MGPRHHGALDYLVPALADAHSSYSVPGVLVLRFPKAAEVCGHARPLCVQTFRVHPLQAGLKTVRTHGTGPHHSPYQSPRWFYSPVLPLVPGDPTPLMVPRVFVHRPKSGRSEVL